VRVAERMRARSETWTLLELTELDVPQTIEVPPDVTPWP
jgi:hypothetical protein